MMLLGQMNIYLLFVAIPFVTLVNTSNDKLEQTFILLKPDSVHRALVGEIIERFETNGFKLVAIKFVWPTRELIEQHYAEHADKSFFPKMVDFMTSGPVVPMVWKRLNAIAIGRQMLGKSVNNASLPGTIRGDYSLDRERNVIHGAHSLEAAQREINLWFSNHNLINSH